jgi:hypothetical protein
MFVVVYLLYVAGPSAMHRNIQQERIRQVQYSSPTEGFDQNNTEIACITYWTLGCPKLQGPFFPSKLDVSSSSKNAQHDRLPTLGLLRYILNPLPGYYDADQIETNLKAILAAEPLNVKQHWFLFRLTDTIFQEKVVAILQQSQQTYTIVPFDWAVYAKIPYTFHYFDHYKNHRDVVHNKWYRTAFSPAKKAAVLGSAIRDKTLYVFNRNAARNYMLEWVDVEWGDAVDWWIPLDPDIVWTNSVHRTVTQSLLMASDVLKYVVLPTVQQTTPDEPTDHLDPWTTTPLEVDDISRDNPYDQTAKLLHHTPRDGYQIIFRRGAVGRFHPFLPMGRYDTEEFLSRLRSVDGYGWWNVTTEGTWLPWEMSLLTEVPSPDSDTNPTEDHASVTMTAHETDPWRLSLQLPPSDALSTSATSLVDIPVIRLYSQRATRLAIHDPLNATYFDQQYLVESMASALPSLNYQVALAASNATGSFYSTTIANRLFFFDRAMLKYEQKLYRQAQYQSLDEMTSRVQSLVWMIHKLVEQARDSHRLGPWSVVDKPPEFLPPSGNPHDYYNVAPHFVPPILDDGSLGYTLPYEKKGWGPIADELYGPKSSRYDATRFTSMAYNVTILSLATFFTGQDLFAQYAVKMLKYWFWGETAMTPHMRFASVRWNHNETDWQGEHITDLRALYFLLDAASLLEEGDHLSVRQTKLFRQWMEQFLHWLESDLQAVYASSIDGYQGLYYDIMCASISFYLRDEVKALHYVQWAASRMRSHFNDRYEMEVELSTSHCEDSQMQGLLAWQTLARLADHVGYDLWGYSVANFDGNRAIVTQVRLPDDPEYDPEALEGLPMLCAASARAIPFVLDRPVCKGDSGHNQRQNLYRWWPLLDGYRRACPSWPVENLRGVTWGTPSKTTYPPSGRYNMPYMFPHQDNIPPFWNLGYRVGQKQ